MRSNYFYFRRISTRWKDNDIYGHINNVEYYSFFDTVINLWLLETGELDIRDGQTIGVCAESKCRYHASLAFPEEVDAGLRIVHIGRTSVRYEVGLFAADSSKLAAEGSFVHVFVDKKSRQPAPFSDKLRASFQSIYFEVSQ